MNPARQNTGRVMQWVLLACLPGALCLIWFFGWGYLINLVWISGLALAFEALGCALRNRPVKPALSNCSALVTGVLLALALPSFTPWWASMIAAGFAILIGKQLFGGLGHNPFNPAMLGYAVLIIAFPLEMATWTAPRGIVNPVDLPTNLEVIFAGGVALDAWTMPTPLDAFKFREGLSSEEIWQSENGFGSFGGLGWEWVNLAFLLGGLWLLHQRIISWHAPVGMLAAIAFLAVAFYDAGSSSSKGSPMLHLFSGGTMLAAFLIVTDPASGPASRQGQLLFGIGAGTLIFLIRAFGGYPDAIAFAVLIMNMTTPMIDLPIKIAQRPK